MKWMLVVLVGAVAPINTALVFDNSLTVSDLDRCTISAPPVWNLWASHASFAKYSRVDGRAAQIVNDVITTSIARGGALFSSNLVIAYASWIRVLKIR
jgi:hypothetical protein